MFLQKLVVVVVPLCALFTRIRLKLIMNHHCISVKVTLVAIDELLIVDLRCIAYQPE